jgi:acetoin:2,6-dichlorophenolindophenol oxidoreductase subunit beta
MAIKNGQFSVLEAIQAEMKRDQHLTLLYEYQRPTAVSPTGKVIDLYKEFGPVRVPDWGPIDEEWFVGACAGMAMTGVRSIAHCPSMTPLRTYELFFNQISKLRYMTGGQASMAMVLWQDMPGRGAGSAAQHADAGQEALYAALPGLKVVVPADPYEIKGLMAAAIRDPDPVVFFHYGAANAIQVDVPDEEYVVKIGEARTYQEGKDVTIVGNTPAIQEIVKAIPGLKEAGVSAEIIDPRTVQPLPIDTIINSVKKTGRLIAVDHGHQTLCGATEIIARVAMAVPGTKLIRLAFPDAPAPAAREMITWMTPDAPKIVAAAKKIMTM